MVKSITTNHLAKDMARALKITATDSQMIIKDTLALMTQSLAKKEDVKISGFGRFSVRAKKERIGTNLQTGEKTIIAARHIITFSSSSTLIKK